LRHLFFLSTIFVVFGTGQSSWGKDRKIADAKKVYVEGFLHDVSQALAS
jgi:hypothetical protein